MVRSHPLQEQPYTGMVPITSGEVAEDLARYLVDSEQTNSALGLGVSIARDASVRAAGGFLLQVGAASKCCTLCFEHREWHEPHSAGWYYRYWGC